MSSDWRSDDRRERGGGGYGRDGGRRDDRGSGGRGPRSYGDRDRGSGGGGYRRDDRRGGGGGFRSGGGGGGGGFRPRFDASTAKTDVFEVDADHVKFIIGRGGNKIRDIQDTCRVSVQIGT